MPQRFGFSPAQWPPLSQPKCWFLVFPCPPDLQMLEFLQAQSRILFFLTQLLFGVSRPVAFNASFVQIPRVIPPLRTVLCAPGQHASHLGDIPMSTWGSKGSSVCRPASAPGLPTFRDFGFTCNTCLSAQPIHHEVMRSYF